MTTSIHEDEEEVEQGCYLRQISARNLSRLISNLSRLKKKNQVLATPSSLALALSIHNKQ